MPCTDKYTTVTLAAGEQFTLPPGATLVSATNINAITDDGCLDREQLEELECYALVLTASADFFPSSENPWDNNHVYISKITINNIDYTVGTISTSSPGDYGDWVTIGQIENAINANPEISGLFSDFNYVFAHNGAGGQGGTGSICFKTIPSIGDNMTVTVRSTVETINDIDIEIKVHPVSYYAGNGICSCETAPLGVAPLPSALSAPIEPPVETPTTTEPDVPTTPSV